MTANDQHVASFSIEPDFGDWNSANWLVIRNHWLWKRLMIFTVCVWAAYSLILIIADLVTDGWHVDWIVPRLIEAVPYTLVVSVVLLAFVLWLAPRRVRKAVREAKRLAPQTEYEFDEASLRLRNAIGTNDLAWPLFQHWLENSRVIVLVLTARNFLIIPKAAISPIVCEQIRSKLIVAKVPNR